MSTVSSIILSFSFSASFLLFLAFLYTSVRRKEDREYLPTALMFLGNAIYIFGEYMLNTSQDFGWRLFWQRFEYTGPALLMSVFPLSAFAFAGRETSRAERTVFRAVMPAVSAGFIVLLFAGELLITSQPYLYSGIVLQGKEGNLFPLYGGILYSALVYGYTIIIRAFHKRRRPDDWPLVVGTGLGILTGLVDVLRIFLPFQIGFGSFFVHGILVMNFLYGYSFFRRYVGLYRRIDQSEQILKEKDETIHENEKTIHGLLNISRKEFRELLDILLQVIDAKDRYTAGHSLRVSEYAVKLGQALKLDKPELKNLKTASLLHDIGKIGVNEQILNKPGKLTEEEFAAVKTHPDTGVAILGNADDLFCILDYVRFHHERMDGKGYPGNLPAEKIPTIARIIAVADTYDALTSDRPYRRRMSNDEAIRILREAAGTQLDPALVELFIPLIS
jgi:hypothetical protein